MKSWEELPVWQKFIFTAAFLALFYLTGDYAAEIFNQIVYAVLHVLREWAHTRPRREDRPLLFTSNTEAMKYYLQDFAHQTAHDLYVGPQLVAEEFWEWRDYIVAAPHAVLAFLAVFVASVLLLAFFLVKVVIPFSLMQQKARAGDAATREKKE